MVYVKTITTDKSTAEASPLRSQIKAIGGVVYAVEVYFPPGSAGLCGVQIWSANVALYPIDRDEWFLGDNVTIRFDDIREIALSENLIDVYTYNIDTVWSHEVQIRLGILPVDLYEERYGVGRAMLKANEALAETVAQLLPTPFPRDTSIVDALAAGDVTDG